MGKKKTEPFNNPFHGLKLPEPPPAEPEPALPPPAQPLPRRHEELSEEDLWSLALDGAQPLQDRKARVKPRPESLSVAPPELDPDLEAYDELRALVTGEVPFDISDS
ncbi:MAG TPA: DNA mismatch repair protein MutS, partial [Myxococcales bacterium]